jgi:hypothetical protein
MVLDLLTAVPPLVLLAVVVVPSDIANRLACGSASNW